MQKVGSNFTFLAKCQYKNLEFFYLRTRKIFKYLNNTRSKYDIMRLLPKKGTLSNYIALYLSQKKKSRILTNV